MMHDPLADALSTIKNADNLGRTECVVRASKMARAILQIMQEKGYISSFDSIDDGKSGKFKIELKGKIVDCKTIKPRHSTKVDEYDRWEKRFLPAREFGILIVSTSKGVMDHKKAMEQGAGGKLVAYVY